MKELIQGAGVFIWPLARGWTGMAAFIFIAHCGAFQLLSCGYRARGIDAKPLMNSPLFAQSTSEFWGKRWNTAFRDLAYQFLFQPLSRHWGPKRGVLAGFVFSGAVHELAVTLPAGGGYGGPTFFFTLQGAAILIERSHGGRHFGLGKGATGWAFAMLMLLAPAGLAFPPIFLHNIVLPFMQALHAL